MNEIASLVYLSRAGEVFRKRDSRQQLKIRAQTENMKHDITGLLIYSEGIFLQIIEGTNTTIDSLYAKISHDPRHSELDLLTRTVSATRMFSKWSMGIVETEDLPDLHVSLNDRLSAIAALRARMKTEQVPASLFIEVFLDPKNAGLKHAIS
jgi:Sensors of blue-light using FAD